MPNTTPKATPKAMPTTSPPSAAKSAATTTSDAAANFASGTVWTEDNLNIMRGMNTGCVDLIYLDPPFNSNANYAAPIGSKAAGAAFKDTWGLTDIDLTWHGIIKSESPGLYALLASTRIIHSKSMMAYLIYMAIRIMEMRRILKPTGSIYLHCDPTASHYLKLLMDAIFGKQRIINEIIWERIKGAGKRSQHESKGFGRSSDTILVYANGSNYTFNDKLVTIPYSNLARDFPYQDAKGHYKRRSPFRPPGLGVRPNLCYAYKGIQPPHASGWTVSHARLEQLDEDGEIDWVDGKPWRKQRPATGILPNNIWGDINQPMGDERTGYPTQKPLALLERIVKVSSNPGDMVFDPFCGCATTLVIADRLQRQWAGIDLSPLAIKLVEERINDDRKVGKDKTDGKGLFGGAISLTNPPQRTDLGTIPPYNSTQNRDHLYGIQGGDCNGCGEHFLKQHLTIDHYVPLKKGGSDHISNLQMLCAYCNSVKGDRDHAYLIARLIELNRIKREI